MGIVINYLLSLITPLTSVLLMVALCLYVLSHWPVWDRSMYPPGPLPLPFIGHSLWFYTSGNVFKRLFDLRHKYGDLITLDINEGKLVVLNTAEAIHEGFVKNSAFLSDRPMSMHNPATGGYGLVHEKNGRWKDLRKHACSVFKERGVGSRGIDEVIQEELKFFLQVLKETNEKPFDIKEQLTQGVNNIITSIVFGQRCNYSDEHLANLQITEFRDIFEKTKYMPILRKLPGDITGFKEATRRHAAGLKFAKDQIAEHRKNINYYEPKDYIESYLVEMDRRSCDQNTQFTDLNLITSVMSLYLSGTDTSGSQIYWAFLYMVLYPEVQERIYQEIKQNVGERQIEFADRLNMPYSRSTMTELLRIGIALGTLLHVASEDIQIRGQTIPKGTSVYANVWGPLHDPEVYPKPEEFRADRFLDEEGNFCSPDPKYFPVFSAGKRKCLGEALARHEIFLIMVGTLQKFKLELGQDKVPSEKGKRMFVWIPEERFKMKFIPR